MSKIKKIGVVSLSCQVNDETRKLGIEEACKFLLEKGIEIVYGESTDFVDQFVAPIKNRVDDMHSFFADPSIDLILNLTGGYNCNEILEFLDYDLIAKNPKHFVGYSDITSINLAMFTKSGIKTINGTMLVDYCFDKTSMSKLLEFLENPQSKKLVSYDYYYTDNIEAKIDSPMIKSLVGKDKVANGESVVGNLSTFNLLLGTEYLPGFKGKILFLEYDKEEDKALPSLQRMLWQIRQNSVFDNLAGMVFGVLEPIVKNEELELKLNFEKILTDVTSNYSFPVLYDLQFGHIYPSLIIQNGTKMVIENENIYTRLD
jgi:muramoyltetrapeptide carboxypeptidase